MKVTPIVALVTDEALKCIREISAQIDLEPETLALIAANGWTIEDAIAGGLITDTLRANGALPARRAR